MNAIDIETILLEILQDDETTPEVVGVQTFEEAGLLTGNRGVVIRTETGQEFEITIVQSR